MQTINFPGTDRGYSQNDQRYLYVKFLDVWAGKMNKSWYKSKTINIEEFKKFNEKQRDILYTGLGKEFRDKYMLDEDRIDLFFEF